MGAYLSQPNTVKSTGNGGNQQLSFGFAAMQGWRVSMEDAHNCIPELDEETAMFAVYDGHGGEEVALYCSKYLPEIIKEQKAYKEGKLQKALEDAFLAIDARMTMEDIIKELAQIAGRPQEDEDKEKVADEEDDCLEQTGHILAEAEPILTGQPQVTQSTSCSPQALALGKLEPPLAAGSTSDWGDKLSGGPPITESPVERSAGAVGRDEGLEVAGCSLLKASVGEYNSLELDASGERSSGEARHREHQASSGTCGVFVVLEEEAERDEVSGGERTEDGSEDRITGIGEDGEYSSAEEDEDDEEDSDEAEDEEMLLPGMEGKEEPGSDSGTTAVVALIRGKQLIVANAGDSRCVVSEGGKAVDMSYDHKPEDEVELSRIKNAGGKVTMDGRVNGGLNLSRAIGDHFYKRNKTLPPEEQMISAMPDVKVLTLNEEHDFMVIACDGIWNVMSSQEVVHFVSERIKHKDNGEVQPLSSIVEELLDQCLAPDTSGDGTGCDNMTCIIITFSPHRSSCQSDSSRKRKDDQGSVEKNGNGSSKKTKIE
ncbi:PPM1G phosphatase, partial [Polyodon spathula]|nr:PPM1G phosphatase [Polyodon spathula]